MANAAAVLENVLEEDAQASVVSDYAREIDKKIQAREWATILEPDPEPDPETILKPDPEPDPETILESDPEPDVPNAVKSAFSDGNLVGWLGHQRYRLIRINCCERNEEPTVLYWKSLIACAVQVNVAKSLLRDREIQRQLAMNLKFASRTLPNQEMELIIYKSVGKSENIPIAAFVHGLPEPKERLLIEAVRQHSGARLALRERYQDVSIYNTEDHGVRPESHVPFWAWPSSMAAFCLLVGVASAWALFFADVKSELILSIPAVLLFLAGFFGLAAATEPPARSLSNGDHSEIRS